jgi:hypothetical protein
MTTTRWAVLVVLFLLTAGVSLAEAGTTAPDGSGCSCPLCLGRTPAGTILAP